MGEKSKVKVKVGEKLKSKAKVKSGMVDIPICALTRDHETQTQLPRGYAA